MEKFVSFLDDQMLQKVRKGVFAEISAFRQFVKAKKKYANILAISTILPLYSSCVLSDIMVWNSNKIQK